MPRTGISGIALLPAPNMGLIIVTNSTAYWELSDRGDKVRFEPLDSTLPVTQSGLDNGLDNTKVTVRAGVFHGEFLAEFTIEELEDFKRQLRGLEDDLSASTLFEPIEGHLVLRIRGDGRGHFEVECEATPEWSGRQTLTFKCSFDQTELKNLIRMLDGLMRAFKVDGRAL